jgi:hypothetical protein
MTYATSRKVVASVFDGTGFFSCTMAQRLTQPLTEMSTSWLSRKCGSLDISQTHVLQEQLYLYLLHRSDGLRWHDIPCMFHQVWFAYSGNIKVIISTFWEAAVSVTNANDLWCVPLRWPHMAWYIHTKFHDDWFKHLSNIKDITSTILEAVMLVLLMRGIYDVCSGVVLRWHDIYVPSLMKIGIGIQSILSFCLRNWKGCNVGNI